jgi:hypothetical protein
MVRINTGQSTKRRPLPAINECRHVGKGMVTIITNHKSSAQSAFLLSSFNLAIIFSLPGIVSKNNQADGDRSEYRNDDDPWNRFADIAFCGIDVGDCAVHHHDDGCNANNDPQYSEKSFQFVHFIKLKTENI